MKRYQALEPGDVVESDQLVMVLEDREAQAQYDIHASAVKPARDELTSSEFTRAAVEEILKKFLELGKGVIDVEVLKAKVDGAKSSYDVAAKKAALNKAEEELNQAEVLLEMYYIHSQIAGTIQPTNRKRGEGVKQGDTVFQVLGTNALRAEGMIATGYHQRLTRGMPVLVEPSREDMAIKSLRSHNQAVTGIAISNHTPEPLIVSSSEDKYVWVFNRAGPLKSFKHDVAVRCVACTPVGAKQHLCLTGADHGRDRTLDLDP